MAGIRRINAPAETFRFPEWRQDIFYAADSVVRYASWMSDSDGSTDLRTKFYIAVQDVSPGSGAPSLSPGLWADIMSSSSGIAAYIQDIFDNDSDIQALKTAFFDHDSDSFVKFHQLDEYDSDLKQHHDSDHLALLRIDSDMRHDHDSDMLTVFAADSDLRHDLDSEIQARKDADSDMESDHDSDMDVLLGADSDLRHDLDSEIQARKDADSDIIEHFDSDLLAFDSEIRRLIDSEMQARMDADSDIIEHFDSDIQELDSEIRRLLDSEMHARKDADSDLVTDIDSDLTVLRNADSDIIEHFDSDLRALDSEIRRLLDSEYISRKAFDSEIRHDLDSDVKRLVREYTEADSDQTLEALINVTMYDSDSEGSDSYVLQQGYALAWDSDLNKWRPMEAASRVSNLKDVTLLDSDGVTSALQNGYALAWDSDFDIWRPMETASRIENLKDVDLTNLAHNAILRYDSDAQLWNADFDTTIITRQKNETFFATDGQRLFPLSEIPLGDVTGARNGIMIHALAFFTDSDNLGNQIAQAVYDSDTNNFQRLEVGDRVDISYIYDSVSVATTTVNDIIQTLQLNQLGGVSDSDYEEGQVLVYDAALGKFRPGFATATAAPTTLDGGGA